MKKVKAVLNIGWDTHGVAMLEGETQEVEDGIASRMFSTGCAIPVDEVVATARQSVPPPTPVAETHESAPETEVVQKPKSRRRRQKPFISEEDTDG